MSYSLKQQVLDKMRKVKYFVANSLDNFIARKDGAVDWLFMDGDYGMNEFFKSKIFG